MLHPPHNENDALLAGPEAVPVTDGRAPQLLLGPTEQPLVLRVSLPEPRKLSLYAEYPIGEGLHGEICTRCEGGVALDCVALSAGSIDFVERDVQGDFWLKLSFTPDRRRLAPLRLTFEAR
jgi:hypothetical protein